MLLATPLISPKHFIDKIEGNGHYSYDLTQWIDKNLFFFGHYEKNEQELVKKLLRRNSVFLDIGANSGIYSILASNKCSRIFAFEPDTVSRSRLKRNIKLNQLTNIEVIPLAVSDRERRVFLYTNPSNRGMNSLFNYGDKHGRLSVKTITIDRAVKKYGIKKVALVKMDIEGSELNALKGSINTIKKYKPGFLIEINSIYSKDAGFRVVDIYNFFKSYDYRPFAVNNGGYRKMGRREFLHIKQQNVFFKPQKDA
jgi:FkbM family methyltransferase